MKIYLNKTKKVQESRKYIKPVVTSMYYNIELGYAGSGRPGNGFGDENHHHTGPNSHNGKYF